MNDMALDFGGEGAVGAAADGEAAYNPLDQIVEKTKNDPGAPFAPDVLQALSVLLQNDPAAFERLRAELKTSGCRPTALDKALSKTEGGEQGGRDSKG